MESTLPLRICPAFKLHWVENCKVVSIKRYDHDRTYILPEEIFTLVSRVFLNFNILNHYIKFKDEDGDLVDLSHNDNISFQFDKIFMRFYLYIFTSKEEAMNFVLPCPKAQQRKPQTVLSSSEQVEPSGGDTVGSALNIAESAHKLVLTSATGRAHKNVYCKGCLGDVLSNRYKCLECRNFNLCARCEAKGVHPEHLMARLSQTFVHTHRRNLHDVLDDIYTKAAKRSKYR